MRHLARLGVIVRSAGRPISGFCSPGVILTLISLAFFVPTAASFGDEASASDAWRTIVQFRANLDKDSPLRAEFTQTYRATGFSSGDSETGSMAISLPACLRWDYTDPFPKSFLLCNDEAWYWNPGETIGQRYSVDQQQAGLDFFLMPTETLEDRYDASTEMDEDGDPIIVLVPVEPTEDVVEATLRFDPDNHRLLTLTYVDIEGNQTVFEISDYQVRHTFDERHFVAPPEIDWQDPE